MHARRTILLLATLLVASCGTEAPPGSGGSANPGDVTRALAGDRNLTGANLAGANLTRARLIGANLGGAILTGVHCDATTRWPDGFTPPTCLP